MKKFISGLIVGILLSVLPVAAAIEEYICYKADYKVIINDEEYTNFDLPILNYKGNTYAPFRSILETAGLDVNWNAELNQAEVTNMSTEILLNESEANFMSTTMKPKMTTYKNCEAIEQNDIIYVAISYIDKFGFNIEYDVHTQIITFIKDNKSIMNFSKTDANYCITYAGKIYIKTNILE